MPVPENKVLDRLAPGWDGRNIVSLSEVRGVFCEAVYARRVAELAGELLTREDIHLAGNACEFTRRALDSCESLARELEATLETSIRHLRKENIMALAWGATARRLSRHSHLTGSLSHTLDLLVMPSSMPVATAALLNLGFRRADQWTAAAWKSSLRYATSMSFIRPDENATRIDLHWRIRGFRKAESEVSCVFQRAKGYMPNVNDIPKRGFGRRLHLGPLFTPGRGDWLAASLPQPLWPLYSLIRPFRLIMDRMGNRRSGGSFGPFVATPKKIVSELVEFAGVNGDDHIADFGCGDGRVLIEAVRETGCWATGWETNSDLAKLAVKNVEEAGFGRKISINTGNASVAPSSGFSVIFLFVSPDTVGIRVPEWIDQLDDGACIVAHEQTRLPLESLHQIPIITSGGSTVAHMWAKPNSPLVPVGNQKQWQSDPAPLVSPNA